MRAAAVQGLTPDGRSLLLRLDDEVVEVPLADIRQAQRAAPRLPLGGGPSPREIQARIRAGESSEQIARGCGLPVEDVARYEGPVLAERAHQAALARRADTDGRTVEQRVAEHAAGLGADALTWDCFQTDPRRWEVTASGTGPAGTFSARLAWDPVARRVDPVDEAARQALGHAPLPEDALEAVLRQVRSPGPRRELPASVPPRRTRAQVPLWGEISAEVAGSGSTRQPEG